MKTRGTLFQANGEKQDGAEVSDLGTILNPTVNCRIGAPLVGHCITKCARPSDEH